MRSTPASRIGACLAVALTIGACTGSKEEPAKFPLDRSQAGAMGGGATGTMSGEAKMALDSANILYRAKAYDRALAQYRRSAQLAPMESAPLLGILMVADVTKNQALSDSTVARMKALDPAAPADSSLADIHSKAMKAAPPDAKKK